MTDLSFGPSGSRSQPGTAAVALSWSREREAAASYLSGVALTQVANALGGLVAGQRPAEVSSELLSAFQTLGITVRLDAPELALLRLQVEAQEREVGTLASKEELHRAAQSLCAEVTTELQSIAAAPTGVVDEFLASAESKARAAERVQTLTTRQRELSAETRRLERECLQLRAVQESLPLLRSQVDQTVDAGDGTGDRISVPPLGRRLLPELQRSVEESTRLLTVAQQATERLPALKAAEAAAERAYRKQERAWFARERTTDRLREEWSAAVKAVRASEAAKVAAEQGLQNARFVPERFGIVVGQRVVAPAPQRIPNGALPSANLTAPSEDPSEATPVDNSGRLRRDNPPEVTDAKHSGVTENGSGISAQEGAEPDATATLADLVDQHLSDDAATEATALVMASINALSPSEVRRLVPAVLKALIKDGHQDQRKKAGNLVSAACNHLEAAALLDCALDVADACVQSDDAENLLALTQQLEAAGAAPQAREAAEHALRESLDGEQYDLCQTLIEKLYQAQIVTGPELANEILLGLHEKGEHDSAITALATIGEYLGMTGVAEVYCALARKQIEDDKDADQTLSDLAELQPTLRTQMPNLVHELVEYCNKDERCPDRAGSLLKARHADFTPTDVAALTESTWVAILQQNNDDAATHAEKLLRAVKSSLTSEAFGTLAATLIQTAFDKADDDDGWLDDARRTIEDCVADLPVSLRRALIVKSWGLTVENDSDEPSEDAENLLSATATEMGDELPALLADLIEKAADEGWWDDLYKVLDEHGDSLPVFDEMSAGSAVKLGKASGADVELAARLGAAAKTVLEADKSGECAADQIETDLAHFMPKIDCASRQETLGIAVQALLQHTDWDVDRATEIVEAHAKLVSLYDVFSGLTGWAKKHDCTEELFDLIREFRTSFQKGQFGTLAEELA